MRLPAIALTIVALTVFGFICQATGAYRERELSIRAQLQRASVERSTFICLDQSGALVTSPTEAFSYCTTAYYTKP